MDSVAHAVINYLDAEHSVGNLASLSTLTVEVFRCQGDDRKFPGLRWNSRSSWVCSIYTQGSRSYPRVVDLTRKPLTIMHLQHPCSQQCSQL